MPGCLLGQELPPPPEKKQVVEKKANVHSGTTARISAPDFGAALRSIRSWTPQEVKRYRPSSFSGKRRREAMNVKQEASSAKNRLHHAR